MLGEEAIVAKILDGIDRWFQRRKEEKELVREVLIDIKVSLEKIPLHMKLCMSYGHIKYKEFGNYLTSDIDDLHTVISKYANEIGISLYEDFKTFIDILLHFNETIHSLYIGIGKELTEEENFVKEAIDEMLGKINEKISEIE